MQEKLLIIDTPKEVIEFTSKLDDLISGKEKSVKLPVVFGDTQYSDSYTLENLADYFDTITSGQRIFIESELNGKAYKILAEIINLRAKEKESLTPIEFFNFSVALNDLLAGKEKSVKLPIVFGGTQYTDPVTLENLSEYCDNITSGLGIFTDSELNALAREVLDEAIALRAKEKTVLNSKPQTEVFTFSQALNDLLAGKEKSVKLPIVFGGTQYTDPVTLENLSEYCDNITSGQGIFTDSELNTSARQVLDEVIALRTKEKTLTAEEIGFAITANIENLETQIETRTADDIRKKERILDFAKSRRRLVIKLEVFGLLSQEVPPSPEEFKVKIEPLLSPDADDRKTAAELKLKYNQLLTENFCKLSTKKISPYSIGARRLLVEETQRLLGTSLIINGNQAKLAELLDLAALQQRSFFKDKLRRLTAEKTLSIEAIDEVIVKFDTFNVDDLNYKTDLRLQAAAVLRKNNEISLLKRFRSESAEEIIAAINALPEEYPEDTQLKELLVEEFKRFIELRKDTRVADYNFIFKNDIDLIKKQGATDYEIRDVGRNYEGMQLTRTNYRERLMPLLQVFEGDKEAMVKIAATLSAESRKKYVIDIEQLMRQRKLTPIEEAWFKSAELTSFTIPYLKGLVAADREIALQHFEYLFAKISRETKARLNQPQYFPCLVVGLGPNGMAGLAEIRRLQPALLDGTLIVDQARNPAGPFGVPESAAFNLNSQAPRQSDRPQLPNAPTYAEETSIQGYVSPLQALPGQRTEGERVIRGLSINQTDPALIADKDIASDIYPNNEDLEIVINLQAAMTVKNLALSTRMVKVEKNTTGLPGTKLVTLEITEVDGTKRLMQVTNDLLITSSGLGEPDFGFDTKGSRAEKVIAASSQQTESIPKVAATLEGFRGLGGRFEVEVGSGLGRDIGIGGKGNSFDTLAEKIVGKFVPAQAREQAKKIRDTIGKIYVFAPNAPKNAREYLEGQRSRYANLADFIDRGDGKGDGERLITFIDTRISDFDFADADTDKPTKDRKVVVFGQDGKPVKNQYGQVIKLDNLFLTTGFKSIQDKIFQTYQEQNGANSFEKKPLTLSSAPRIQVGEELEYDPDTIFIGTGSAFAANQQLQDAKLLDIAKVSPEAADALLRVGAKNLVAIGVKSRDAVAAVNDYIWKRRDKIAELLETFHAQKLDQSIPLAGVKLSEAESVKSARLSNHLSTEQKELFASDVIATELAGTIFKEPGENGPMNRDFIIELTLNQSQPESQPSKFRGPLGLKNLLRGSSSRDPEVPVLNTRIMGVYANELVTQERVVGNPSRITRATNVRTGELLTSDVDEQSMPPEILAAFGEPHFIKTIANILPFSDTEKIRVRVSIRQGTVLPQRTQVKMVNEF